MKIVFTGDASMGQPIIEYINKTPCIELVAIACNQDNPGNFSVSDGIYFFNINDIHSNKNLDLLQKLSVDLIVNFNSLKIFTSELLSIPRLGSINFHPGPLPEYAGLYVYQWGILNGEKDFGVSIHWMENTVDTGDILAEERFAISDEDTGLTLYFKALKRGVVLFRKVIELAADKHLPKGLKQDLSKRKYYSGNIPNNGYIDWKWNSEYIARFVRALSYRPYVSPTVVPRFKIGEEDVEVVSATVAEEGPNGMPGEVLEISNTGIKISTGYGSVIIRKVFWYGNVYPAVVIAESTGLTSGQQLPSTC